MSFEKMTLTNKGKALIAKSLTGTVVNFTKIKMGDGQIAGQIIENMTDVISEKVNLKIGSLVKGDSYSTISSNFRNTAAEDNFVGDGANKTFKLSAMPKVLTSVAINGIVTADFTYSTGTITFNVAPAKNVTIKAIYNLEGFYFREIGIFAIDPDAGEILFSYQNAYALAEYIASASIEIVEKVVGVSFLISSATQITATVDSSVMFMPYSKGQLNAEFLPVGNAIIDADLISYFDTVSAMSKKITWASLKEILKKYFDAFINKKGNTQTYIITDTATLTVPIASWVANTNAQADAQEKTDFPYMATIPIAANLVGGKAISTEDGGKIDPKYPDQISGNYCLNSYTVIGGVLIECVTKPEVPLVLNYIEIKRRLDL